jgi:hypothetical protein
LHGTRGGALFTEPTLKPTSRDELLTTAAAAALLDIAPSSIRRLTLAGILKPAISSGRVRLYRREHVEAARKRPTVGNPNFKAKKRKAK